MSWLELLACPQCGKSGTIGAEDSEGRASLRCVSCARRFPTLGGIPVLLREAEAELDNWRYRFQEFLDQNQHVRHTLLADVASQSVLPPTRRRLRALHDVLGTHRERLTAIFTEAGLTPQPRAASERTAVPSEGSLTAYYYQIHRDWGWDADNDEARQASSTVLRVLDQATTSDLGTLLVLGAGACRLSHDLRHRAREVIALDLNPLPFLVAARLFRGETVPLIELPMAPRDSHTVHCDRALRAEPSDSIHLLLADGLYPPFADASVDTVLTPWFIDQIPSDIAELVPEIHRVLRRGGRWLNFGPGVYHPAHTKLVHRYCFDEVLALVEAGGFELEAHHRERMRYLESPIDAQGRTEEVLTFCAKSVERAVASHADPPWLADADIPVPRFAGLDGYRAPHPMFADIAALIDGARTTSDIAAEMVKNRGLPSDAAGAAVGACIAEIWRSLRPD